MRRLRRSLETACRASFVLLVALAVLGAAVLALVPEFSGDPTGCYWTSALIAHVACHRIPLAGLADFILNLPFFVIFYSWAVLAHAVTSGAILPLPILALCLASMAVLALGVCYPLLWLRSRIGRA